MTKIYVLGLGKETFAPVLTTSPGPSPATIDTPLTLESATATT